MKIRIPFEISNLIYHVDDKQPKFQAKIDDILMWAMETGLDAEYYSMYTIREIDPPSKNPWERNAIREAGAVLTIEAKDALMFMLRWGAKCHKPQKDPFGQ